MQEETVQPQKSPEEQLAEAQAMIAQQKDAMLRALADAENARKRFQAEAASSQKYAIERFAESLLPVMDSLEATLLGEPDHLRVEGEHPRLVAAAEHDVIELGDPDRRGHVGLMTRRRGQANPTCYRPVAPPS